MSRTSQSKGKCSYCSKLFSKRSMSSHLVTCPKRQEKIAQAEQLDGKADRLVHLRVEVPYLKAYWLDLEVNGSATLADLDDYLRTIWLECCGHLSQFSEGRGWGTEIDMCRRIQAVFRPDVTVTHIYDFGSTSETTINTLSMREGKPTTKHPIVLMACNEPPTMICEECDQPATHLCIYCSCEGPDAGPLCDRHAKSHFPRNSDHFATPLVNSPRLGICGYTGPATPPY